MTTIRIKVSDDYYEIQEFLDNREPIITRYRHGVGPGVPVTFNSLTPQVQNEIFNQLIKKKHEASAQHISRHREDFL